VAGVCKPCAASNDCAHLEDVPACDLETLMCVECTETAGCADPTPRCNVDERRCVECLENEHCSSAAAARCDLQVCEPCATDSDCEHIDGKPVCDRGECVQCTVADESACGANSCDPATSECTETPRGSVDTCHACVADSECLGGNQADPDARCVPMQFRGEPREGGFCLRRVAKTCGRPYNIVNLAASLSGAAQEPYCGIDQENVRCEAVLDLESSRACPSGADSSCGCTRDVDGECLEPGLGGLCRTVGPNPNRCTYPCGTNEHCPLGQACLGSPTKSCQ
jgi:hypothetical protein